MTNLFFATSRCLFARPLPKLHISSTLNLFVLLLAPEKIVCRFITHTTSDLNTWIFYCFLWIDLYEETEALTTGCIMASNAISFASIKPIISMMSFSSRLPHTINSLRMSSSVSAVTSTSFTIISIKSTILLQQSFRRLREYEQVVIFPYIRTANGLVLLDKSCLELSRVYDNNRNRNNSKLLDYT